MQVPTKTWANIGRRGNMFGQMVATSVLKAIKSQTVGPMTFVAPSSGPGLVKVKKYRPIQNFSTPREYDRILSSGAAMLWENEKRAQFGERKRGGLDYYSKLKRLSIPRNYIKALKHHNWDSKSEILFDEL
ncbi:hypothetical protein AAMO2058_001341200 [Amorphochlora amoebiformis]